MTIQYINTGTSANAGNGDSIRSAFTKVNQNFDFISNVILGTGTDYTTSVQNIVKPMMVHELHRGIIAEYNDISDQIILSLGTNIFDNITVDQDALFRNVEITGTTKVGAIQGLGSISLQNVVSTASLGFSARNTFISGNSNVTLFDRNTGSFTILHQNSLGDNVGFFTAGQNYIFDDQGRSINIGRNSDINFYADQSWAGYTNPSLTISNTGSVIVNSTLTLSQSSLNVGGKQVEFIDNSIFIDNIQVNATNDRLTAGDFTATLTTAGNFILPGNTILEYSPYIPPGQAIFNEGATFSLDGPFEGVGSIYFDGSSRITVPGGSHFDLNTGTYTIEWFQKPTVFENESRYTVFILGDLIDQALQGVNFYSTVTTSTALVIEGAYEMSAPYVTEFLNTWTHVAVVRTATSLSIFINGVQTLNAEPETLPIPVSTTSDLTIGAALYFPTYVNSFTGYISNMRWEAREVYTATFTPPDSILTASINTRLLLTTENSSTYLWDTAGIVKETPQALSIVLNSSTLKLSADGELVLNQNGAYDESRIQGTLFRIDTDQPNYTQLTLHNLNSGTVATSDIIFVRDNGDVESATGLLDIGINSSNYVEEQTFGVHTPGSAYMFTNDADLIIGTQNPGRRLIFHAGGTTTLDSAGYLDDFAWRFNRNVQVIFGTPGPLNFTIQNQANNSAAQAVYQAINDTGDYIHFGINSSNPGAVYGNIGPGESFIHNHSTTATLHIGSEGSLAFYSDEINGFSGTPTLVMSRVDRSSTFAGHVLPAEDLVYDLGSSSTQWRSLWVGTSTIYIGGIPVTINTISNTLAVGVTPGTTATTATSLATESFVIDYVNQFGGSGGLEIDGGDAFTIYTAEIEIDGGGA